MTPSPESLEVWTLELLRQLYALEDQSSLRGVILRRQIRFNRALLRRMNDRREREGRGEQEQ